MTFLSKDYKVPTSQGGNYMKFKQGDNRFRVLSSAIVGFEYWTNENKPVRSKSRFEGTPEDARLSEGVFRQKHFWAFCVWNYDTEQIEILEVTQKGIMQSIKSIIDDEDYGDPKGYDIVVKRQGEGLDTEYTTMPKPPKEFTLEADGKETVEKINLEALYTGDNPFDTPDDLEFESF